MPILDLEPSVYPKCLFETPDLLAGSWWVLHTKARQEKTLCRHLLAAQKSFYCPMIPHQYRSPNGRRRVSHLPLFTSYVFLRGDEYDRSWTLSTGTLCQALPVTQPAEFVQELSQIHQLIELGQPLTAEERLQPGQRVRIKSGPLTGLTGTILQRREGRRLLVMVNFIQRGASIEIGDFELEPWE
jgi:transcriptional antiterminator RfaH